MPQVPTFWQAGLDLVYDSWFGLMAPAGVLRDVINKINQDVVGILKTRSSAPGSRRSTRFWSPTRRSSSTGRSGTRPPT